MDSMLNDVGMLLACGFVKNIGVLCTKRVSTLLTSTKDYKEKEEIAPAIDFGGSEASEGAMPYQ